ncbi:hypothetical protein AMELA_G00018650 [Ameiurus melas]|uniref:Uncharacterized protein n=1 Tax=Ameiurus melas TaxID=219545 RepID=A0A7J6BB05_AMEME|nr:hypothetical protein AMELA_G00018650 [Ameiurus melas]
MPRPRVLSVHGREVTSNRTSRTVTGCTFQALSEGPSQAPRYTYRRHLHLKVMVLAEAPLYHLFDGGSVSGEEEQDRLMLDEPR